jgi:hypothetical protein
VVSSGYGVEATVESIWDTEWVTARFDFINIALGTRFNFWITGNAATDITDTKVVKLLEVESNDMFAYWAALAKVEKTVNPWDFIQIWMKENFMGDGFLNYFRELILECRKILDQDKWELVSKSLPSDGTETIW